MDTVTLVMQMSCDGALATVVIALHDMPGVSLGPPGWTTHRQLLVTIDTIDPDAVDIVRGIIWQFDGLATQRSARLDVARRRPAGP